MITPYDKEYKATKKIMEGKASLMPEFQELAYWIDKTFDVKTINIIFDLLENNKPRLNICFETESEQSKFLAQDNVNLDPERQRLIAQKFMSTEQSNNLSNNVFVCYSAFQPIAMWEVNEKIPQSKIDELKNHLDNPYIWEISRAFHGVTFFLFTDQQVKEYEKSNYVKLWTDKYLDLIDQFDEFNYYKRDVFLIRLDSKENFDNNYKSNWYYYYK